MADSYGRHLLRTPRHLPARRSPATQSLPLQRARAERSRDPPAPRAPRAHGAPLLDVRYTKQRAVNLHRFWPRNCSKPEHLPRAYVRIVGAMLTRQLAQWHLGDTTNLQLGAGGTIAVDFLKTRTLWAPTLTSLPMPRHASMRLSMGGHESHAQ